MVSVALWLILVMVVKLDATGDDVVSSLVAAARSGALFSRWPGSDKFGCFTEEKGGGGNQSTVIRTTTHPAAAAAAPHMCC